MTASASADDWQLQFAALDAMPQNASGLEKRRRGHRFERVLDTMLASANMEPRTRFRPQGEEVDGSFLFQGRPMLFEAKWTAEPLSASSLYQFKESLTASSSEPSACILVWADIQTMP